MWLIASIPFWLIGAFFLLAAIVASPARKPYETEIDVGKKILFFILMAGVFFIIAAKIAS